MWRSLKLMARHLFCCITRLLLCCLMPGPISAVEYESCNVRAAACSVPSQAGVQGRRSPPEEVAQMRAFAAQVTLSVEHAAAFNHRRATLEAWSRRHMAAVAPATPAFYPFSGFDLLTPVAFRPLASAYALLAEFLPGTPACFVNASCRQVARESATRMVGHMGHQLVRGGRPLTTATMANLLKEAKEVGVLPSLIVLAALLDMHLVGAVSSHASVTLYTQRRVAPGTTWSCATITYQGGIKVKDERDLQPLLEFATPPFVSFLKGGPHGLVARAWFAEAVANRSVAIVQDESGMTLDGIERAGLQVALYGSFDRFVNKQEALFSAYAEQLRHRFAASAVPLPFCYGYCAGSQKSTALIMAVRSLPINPAPRLCIVLATQRSGSSWLTSLLATHPRVAFDPKQESLIAWTDGSRRASLPHVSRSAFHASLEALWASLVARAGRSGAEYVGFKLMWNQVAYPDVAAAFFRARAAFVVLIERRNTLLQLVSSMQSGREGRGHVHDTRQGPNNSLPVHVDPAHALRFVQRTHDGLASMAHWAKSWASDARFVFYEDLVTSTSTVLEEIYSAMGLDRSAQLVEGNHGMETFLQVHMEECAHRIQNAAEVVLALKSSGIELCDCPLPGEAGDIGETHLAPRLRML